MMPINKVLIKRRRITVNHLLRQDTNHLFNHLISSNILLEDPNLDRKKIQNTVVSYITENGGDVEDPFSHGTEITAWWKRFIMHVEKEENELKKHKNWNLISKNDDSEEVEQKPKKMCIELKSEEYDDVDDKP